MKKILVSKYTLYIAFACLIGSIILVIFNLSQIENFQAKYRNEQRQKDIQSLVDGTKKYISAKNNCPRTSNPVPQTFLPELLFEGNSPKGGVSISTLEDMSDFINTNLRDPENAPYMVGTFGDKIYFYTNNYEKNGGSEDTYFLVIESSLCNQVRV